MRPATALRAVLRHAFAVPAGVTGNGGLNAGCTEIMTAGDDAAHGDEV